MVPFIIIWMLFSPILGIPWLCLGLYLSRNKKKINKGYAVPFAILFGTFGYSMRFIGEPDLMRYYAMIEGMQGQTLLFIMSRNRDRLYLRDVLFYFVSKTGNNNILAYIVGFFCYLIIFYVFFDTVNHYKTEFKHNSSIHIFWIGLIMVSVIEPMLIISNVRCVFSYILVSFAAYREWIQKKRNWFTILLYILPIGLHTSTVIVVITRLGVPIFKKYSKKFVLVVFFVPILIRMAYEIFRRIEISHIAFQYIRNAVNKAYYFLNWTEGGWADEVENSLSNRVLRIYGTFFLIMIIIFYHVIKKNKIEVLNEKFNNFLYIIAILALGTLSIKTGVFWRFEAIVVVFSPFILLPVAAYGGKNHRVMLFVLYLSAGIMLAVNLVHMCRNMIMDELLVEYISTSTFKIIWEFLRGIKSIAGI